MRVRDMDKCTSLESFFTVRWSGIHETACGKLFLCLTTLHAKLFLLRALPVCLRDGLLSPALLPDLFYYYIGAQHAVLLSVNDSFGRKFGSSHFLPFLITQAL